jgi:PAS domain S-box-containing protein
MQNRKNSIRKKIMFPFLTVILIILFVTVLIYTIFIYANTRDSSEQILHQDQAFISDQFRLIQDELNAILQLIPYMNGLSPRRFEQLMGDVAQGNLFNWSQLALYKSPTQLQNREKIRYKSHLKTASDMEIYVYTEFETLHVSFVGSVAVRGKTTPTLLEWKLSNDTLAYIQRRLQSQFGLVYYSPKSEEIKADLNHLELITTSPLIKSSIELQLAIKALMGQKNQQQNKPMMYKVGAQKYLISYQQTPWFPHLYAVTVTSLNSVWSANLKLVFFAIGIFALLGGVIYAIYALIIRKIITSIEIISSVSRRVASGDLDQHVFLDHDDEIGELSESFNQMIAHLRDYAESIKDEVNRSQAIISSIPECIIVTDLENRLILANEKAETMFNFSGNKLKGKAILKHINNAELKSALSVPKSDGTVMKEIQLSVDGDEDRIYSLTSRYVDNQNGRSLGIITVLRDLTHARQIDALRDGFLRTVSHELRTPLTSVIGFIEVVMTSVNQTSEKPEYQYLDTALNEAKQLKTLIDDLLDLSQFKAGKVNMEITDINVKELIDSLIVSMKPLTKGKSLKLQASKIDDSIVIRGDYSKVRRVFLNIVSNAIKFTKKGSIRISCRQTQNQVLVAVTDTGIGIRQSEKDIIFEKFRQIDYSSRREYDGIGLGLSIVKELVEMHHGEIKIDSQYGKGSTFTVIFPALKEQMQISDISSSVDPDA